MVGPVHRLSEINEEDWTAYCAGCGDRVDFYWKNGSAACAPRQRERKREQYKRDKYRRLGIY